MRSTEPISSKLDDAVRGRTDTHPAFGVAVVTRSSGSPRTLFQSDLRHMDTITLRIMTAERVRDLNRDWVHPRNDLVEVEMSLSQWGSLVSSIGVGSGVPITIRRTESVVFVPDLPHEPRIAESVAETRDAVRKLLEQATGSLAVLEAAINGKQGVRAIRDALVRHRSSIDNAELNSEFAVTSLKRAAEEVTAQARADIEAQILTAQTMLDRPVAIEAPVIHVVGEIGSD